MTPPLAATDRTATRHAEVYQVLDDRVVCLSVTDGLTYRWLRALLDLAATLLAEHDCAEQDCPTVRAVYQAIRDATTPGPTSEEGIDS